MRAAPRAAALGAAGVRAATPRTAARAARRVGVHTEGQVLRDRHAGHGGMQAVLAAEAGRDLQQHGAVGRARRHDGGARGATHAREDGAVRARRLEGVAVRVVRTQHVGRSLVAEVGGRRRLNARVRAVRGGSDDLEAEGRAEARLAPQRAAQAVLAALGRHMPCTQQAPERSGHPATADGPSWRSRRQLDFACGATEQQLHPAFSGALRRLGRARVAATVAQQDAKVELAPGHQALPGEVDHPVPRTDRAVGGDARGGGSAHREAAACGVGRVGRDE